MSIAQRGRFITLEGGEGAGKTTQASLLEAALRAHGLEIVRTREPGGTAQAEDIRALLVSGETGRWQPPSEALLLMAARYEHVSQIIRPALEAGKWVLCDRFFDSTRIYQGIGKALGEDWLAMLYRLCFGHLTPDVTLYFDLAPQAGLARAAARCGGETRFEDMPAAFHERLRAGFLSLAEQEPERIAVLDASADVESVYAAAIEELNARLNLALKPHPEAKEEAAS